MGLTVRISPKAHQSLREIAEAEHESLQAVLDKVIEEYRRRRFLVELSRAYSELRADEEAWEEIKSERLLWDGTLADGLPEGESWGEDRRPVPSKGRKDLA